VLASSHGRCLIQPVNAHRLLALISICIFLPVIAEGRVGDYLKQPDAWFAGAEGQTITDRILSHQSDSGSWPKNLDTTKSVFEGDRKKIVGTFDNGATTDELRFLARSHAAKKNARVEAAVVKGIAHIIEAQYPTGGWPQLHPPGKQYHRHITFNDGSMVRIMEFLREVSNAALFSFLPQEIRENSSAAFQRGLGCILNCQIMINVKPTVWCAQHDEHTLEPRPARSYEHASFSGSESVGIVRLLMSVENPSAELRAAVEGAVQWLDSARLKGLRIEQRNGEKVLIEDPSAPDLWARFYDLKMASPLFADRDGSRKASFSDLSPERRNGYSWYGTWPEKLLSKEYPAWKRRNQ